jgi:hypothetical protein
MSDDSFEEADCDLDDDIGNDGDNVIVFQVYNTDAKHNLKNKDFDLIKQQPMQKGMTMVEAESTNFMGKTKSF